MSKISPVAVSYVTNSQEVELAFASTACGINREQDRPCNQTSDKADYDRNLKEAQEQIPIKGVRIENMRVGGLVKAAKPTE